MFDLYQEFVTLAAALEQEGIEYALCGGLAMAVYGAPRATVDIDLLIAPRDLQRIKEVARDRGFVHEAAPMKFAGGAVEIHRLSKRSAELGDMVSLDLILATPKLEGIWNSRGPVEVEQGRLHAVSVKGLIEMKRIRGSARDEADILDLKRVWGEGIDA